MNIEETKSQIPNPKSQIPKVCLTIAGLDPSGGAGIAADIKTFTAFGCFAAAAVTSLTFQNTTGVFGAVHQTAQSVRGQVEPVLQDFAVSALKTGMLPNREIIEEVARLVEENDLENFTVDPVVRSTSGFDLIDDAALRSLIEKLFPLSDLITPNLPEAERIAQMKIESEREIEKAAKIMQEMGAKNVLIKGGHLEIWDLGFGISDLNESEPPASAGGFSAEENQPQMNTDKRGSEDKDQKSKIKNQTDKRLKAKDFLFIGDELHIFEADFIETDATHGTGCTLAAAITANLALGKDLIEAVGIAKKFVTEAIRAAPNLGKGHSPINI